MSLYEKHSMNALAGDSAEDKAYIKGFNHALKLADEQIVDERATSLIAEMLKALGKELIELRAENNMLKGVLASHADVRALISELRHIHAHMHNGQAAQARAALGDLLRRFDREST
jgi:hypothetical protein